MAAAMAASLLSKEGLNCAVLSAGISASQDHPASAHAITVMRDEQNDLLPHRSQRVTDKLLASARLVLTMTASHRTSLISSYPKEKDKIHILCQYAGSGYDISDPFGGDEGEYRACANQIKALLHLCIQRIKTEGLYGKF
jgi:protein-tyrosine phosphatase